MFKAGKQGKRKEEKKIKFHQENKRDVHFRRIKLRGKKNKNKNTVSMSWIISERNAHRNAMKQPFDKKAEANIRTRKGKKRKQSRQPSSSTCLPDIPRLSSLARSSSFGQIPNTESAIAVITRRGKKGRKKKERTDIWEFREANNTLPKSHHPSSHSPVLQTWQYSSNSSSKKFLLWVFFVVVVVVGFYGFLDFWEVCVGRG